MVIAQLLPPPHVTENSTGGKDPKVRIPAFPLHCGENGKVIALHLSPAIPPPYPVGGSVVTNDWCNIPGLDITAVIFVV